MTGWLQGRVAVITGSGQGIGAAIAKTMAQEGARVVTNNRRPGSPGGDAETTAKEILAAGGQAIPFYGDISDFKVAEKLITAAVDNFGKIDVLVNNAGGAANHMVWNMTEQEWDECIDSHLKGAFNCIHHASSLMRGQKWGRILNATSWDWRGGVGECNYVAAMAGIVGLSRAVALELWRYGVTSNVYSPMAITRLREVSYEGVKRRYETGFLPKYRWDEYVSAQGPESIPPLLVYLCTDSAADVTGQVFDIAAPGIFLYSEADRKKGIVTTASTWTIEELRDRVPNELLEGYKNPAKGEKL